MSLVPSEELLIPACSLHVSSLYPSNKLFKRMFGSSVPPSSPLTVHE